MERFKQMKETLIGCVQSQMGHLESVDTKELGEVIDMIKDIEEAMYYCTVTEAMEGKAHEKYRYVEDRDMDRHYGKMYYTEPSGSKMRAFAGNTDGAHHMEWEYPSMRDSREGKSHMSRRNYMEAKEMHQPKTTQMKELEKYLQELSTDIVEMIQDASPEEKAFMEKKLQGLAAKINAPA